MCARYTLRTPASIWTQAFFEAFVHLADSDASGCALAVLQTSAPEAQPRYNIAPTQSVWTIFWDEQSSSPDCGQFHWGLLPSWATDRSIASRTVNARSESVASKPAFREAFRSRRCVLPADGYFEWTQDREGKKPHLFERPDRGVFFMAGLWEFNLTIHDEGDEIKSCTILTTSANATASSIHDRMPVLMDATAAAKWVTSAPNSAPNVPRGHDAVDPATTAGRRQDQELLKPASNDFVSPTVVVRRVNSVRHDDPRCVVPVADFGPVQKELF